MYNVHKIVVGLDLSKTDATLIKYTHFIAKVLKAKSITYLHVFTPLDKYMEVQYGSDIIKHPGPEEIKKAMEVKLEEYNTSTGHDFDINVEVMEGNPTEALLKFCTQADADLLVVGKKVDEDGHGVVPAKVATAAPCSVLMVPQNAKANLERILLPTDFSEHSEFVFQEIGFFNEERPREFHSIHVAHLPSGYYFAGKNEEEYAQILKNNLHERHKKFETDHHLEGLKITPHFPIIEHKREAQVVMDLAHNIGADLIVAGSKGMTKASKWLLGSFAEKLIKKDHDIPVLIIKKKGETIGFLDALFRL